VVGKALLALAVAWPMVLAGRLIDRTGKGIRGSPRDAIIADVTGSEIRGRAFGFHRAMDTAGAIVGVLLAAGLLWVFAGSPAQGQGAPSAATSGHGMRIVFGISAVLGLLSLALTFMVKEPEHAAATEAQSPIETAGKLGLPRSYWRTVALMLVFSFTNSSDAFLLLRVRELGLSPWAVVLAYALYNVTYMAVSYPAGVVSDRIGRWLVIALGWAIYAAVYAGFVFTGRGGVWPLLAVYGVYIALTDGVGKAMVSDCAPKGKRGTALGMYSMASGIISLLSSLVAGVLWDRVGPSATFAVGAIGAAIAVILIPILRPRIAAGEPR
jgi:MFS family permease